MSAYEEKKAALTERLRKSKGAVRLDKSLSHLFRGRSAPPATRLDARTLNQVVAVDTGNGTVDVEGMTSYESLTEATLRHGVLPAVVPQLKGITIGGACAGLGIESSSFRYGLAHETVVEMEVLLASGETVVCTPTNEHRDLFFGFPNSFGTLGYALRIKARTVPAKPFVALQHIRHGDPATFFDEVEAWSARAEVDFVDGVVFGPGEHYLTIGRFVDETPYLSDYTYLNIYYRSITERQEDFLTTLDYIWRWDTDWFWCSRMLYAQNPVVRRLLGRRRLNSIFYKKVVDWQPGYRLRALSRLVSRRHYESVIQDVDVTVDKAPAFLDFFQREIGLTPVWICPFRAYDPDVTYPLFPTDRRALYVNFGFWDQKVADTRYPEGHFNRLVEHKLRELGGIKSLYSDSYYTPEEFWALYNRDSYEALKSKYDPGRRLADLYDKCVLRR